MRKRSTVRDRRAAIVAILERNGGMTQTQVWEALQETQHSTGRHQTGNDLRSLHRANRIRRDRRQRWGNREVTWKPPQGSQLHPVQAAVLAPNAMPDWQPPSNIGKVLVFELPKTCDPKPRAMVERCRHGLRSAQCFRCTS